jgi:hypothetical protein
LNLGVILLLPLLLECKSALFMEGPSLLSSQISLAGKRRYREPAKQRPAAAGLARLGYAASPLHHLTTSHDAYRLSPFIIPLFFSLISNGP